ncbi:unnamed protein product [Acanthoscelides obtectus]|uniref:Uncharacterized protein n=1 Tax=Acanthoscelides obtectus TaxID=200917 RepID=A0A9P0NV31_ACAOB|nr:unnamed protein product [Acanthoscelides obtectus]CAK1641424.1 hypothetical protein AOBTE_LOCUS12393 [Acanthoscelides obtectus]
MVLTSKAANLPCISCILSSKIYKIGFSNSQEFSIILSSTSFLKLAVLSKNFSSNLYFPRVFLLDRHNFP